jgi:hypothetical protein
MSYDLVSVPRTDDESWDDALESAERDETTTPPNASAWARILAAGQQILGEVAVSFTDRGIIARPADG